MQIDLLYFDGCPSWEGALENLKTALEAESLQADIHLVKMEDNDDAARLKFLSSPPFRVDGMGWWQEERQRFNPSCRVYVTPQGLKGEPTVEMLREKLQTTVCPLKHD